MVITDNEQIMKRVRILRVHGAEKKYYHSTLGFNSRLDELQAAILRVKLKYLDDWNERRRRNAALYNKLLREQVITPYVERYNRSIYHQYVIRVRRRDELREYLRKRKITTSIYYPLPLHLQECYKELGYEVGDFPSSELASKETLALPMYPELREEQIHYVAEHVLNFSREEKNAFRGKNN
jgi:dTDP-4-amino-4,6-dideoxygalactose transaminase